MITGTFDADVLQQTREDRKQRHLTTAVRRACFVQTTLKGCREQIVSLTRYVTAAQSTNALLTMELAEKKKQCETMQGECFAVKVKVKTAGQKNARLETRLHKEMAKHGATKQDVVFLRQRVADTGSKCNAVAEKLAVTEERLNGTKQANVAISQTLKDTNSKYDATIDKFDAARKKAATQEAKIDVLTKCVANANAKSDGVKNELVVMSKELTDHKTKITVLSKRVEDITAERDAAKTALVAAHDEVAAKDAVIVHQRLEINGGRHLIVALSNANLALNCTLENMWTELKASENVRRGFTTVMLARSYLASEQQDVGEGRERTTG